MPRRTIIDVLRKGNQELFHSSILAWLLDPDGEHGYGPAFLHAFARTVEERGCPKMWAALQAGPVARITTETAAHKSRYDIVLRIGPVAVVIENKTKSLGDEPQFEKYRGDNYVLVALGLCGISFSSAVHDKYPVVTYGDVLALLDRLPEPPPSDFRVLADHYREFLRRELAVLSEIDGWYTTGDPARGAAVPALVDCVGTCTQNDRRFLNLYLLEHLRRQLLQSSRWGRCRLKLDKNMQSGVWLAAFGVEGEGGVFRYADPLAALWKQHDVSVWFHIELWDGVLASVGDRAAGVIQLRCGATTKPKELADRFRAARPLRDGEKYPSRVGAEAGSYYLLARPLVKAHLTAMQFVCQLDLFAESFGTFTVGTSAGGGIEVNAVVGSPSTA